MAKITERNIQVKNVEDYIDSFPAHVKTKLEKLRQTIKKAAPGAEEVISYSMPAFKFYGILAWFAGYKNHYAIYVRPKFKEPFKKELESYETTKSAIKFSFDQTLPVSLITKIIKFAVKENSEKNLK